MYASSELEAISLGETFFPIKQQSQQVVLAEVTNTCSLFSGVPISFYTLLVDLTYVKAEEVSQNYERNASTRALS